MESAGYIRTDMGFDYEDVGRTISVDALAVFLATITEIVPDGQPPESLKPLVLNLIDHDPNGAPPNYDDTRDEIEEDQHDKKNDGQPLISTQTLRFKPEFSKNMFKILDHVYALKVYQTEYEGMHNTAQWKPFKVTPASVLGLLLHCNGLLWACMAAYRRSRRFAIRHAFFTHVRKCTRCLHTLCV